MLLPEMQIPKTGRVYTKEPLTPEEIEHLCKVLEEREEWQKLAYVKFTYSTGCRRAESRQLLKEVVNYTPKRKMVTIIDENGKEQEVESVSYKTHEIRCKGRSSVGKVRHLQFGQDVMDTLKKWLEIVEKMIVLICLLLNKRMVKLIKSEKEHLTIGVSAKFQKL